MDTSPRSPDRVHDTLEALPPRNHFKSEVFSTKCDVTEEHDCQSTKEGRMKSGKLFLLVSAVGLAALGSYPVEPQQFANPPPRSTDECISFGSASNTVACEHVFKDQTKCVVAFAFTNANVPPQISCKFE